MLLARSLSAIVAVATALAVGGCSRTDPLLRLAVADSVESTDLESGSTLVVRGSGFPIGAPVDVLFEGSRRSYLHPGAVELTLPAMARAHDRVEVPLDGPTTALLLGDGDDDARLAGDIELQFRTSGAIVATKALGVDLRVRSFPRNARIAAEKRARVDDALGALGLHVTPQLVLDRVAPCILRRGDVSVGDRIASLDGVGLAALDDALPPATFGFTSIETTNEDGVVHRARGFVGLARLGGGVVGLAVALGLAALLRKLRPVAALPSAAAWSVPPSRASVMATGAAAVVFELMTRFLRVRLDAPIVLTLLAIAIFGPARRSVTLALAMALATSAALVSGGVFRVDELHGALGPLALPSLAVALFVWSQRFAGAWPSRSATTALLFVTIPLAHVAAPRVGVLPALGRALAAATLALVAAPALQRTLLPLREGATSGVVAGALVGALAALVAAIVGGPVAGAVAGCLVAIVLFALRTFAMAVRRRKSSP